MLKLFLLFVCGGLSQMIDSKSIESKSEKLPITFDDVIPNRFGQLGFGGTWISATEFTYRSGGEFVKFNVETNQTEKILDAEFIQKQTHWTGASFRVSSDSQKVLVRYAPKQIFRHSTVSKFSIVRLNDKDEYKVANGEEIQIAFFEPNGRGLSYIVDNNLFHVDIPDIADYAEPQKITNDGKPGVIYNGIPDWVYEEEVLGSDAATWISPSGSYLAYARFDDENVKESVYDVYGDLQYPQEVHLRYPKAGTTNPTVALFVVKMIDLSTKAVEIPKNIVTEDYILGSVFWIGDDSLGAIWTNRRQNVAVFVSYDTTSSDYVMNEVMKFDEPNGWIDINTPKCDSKFVCYFINNYNNWPTLTSVDAKKPENLLRLSSDGVNVLTFYGIAADGEYFYLANPKLEPANRHVYSSTKCLSCNLKSPEGNLCLYASATFSKDFSYYSITCSGPDPSFTKFFKTTGNDEFYYDYEMNNDLRTRLLGYDIPNKYIFHVPVDNGKYNAAVMMILPEGAEFNYPDRVVEKYPMLVRVYGGPGSVRISSAFSVGFQSYQVSSKKIVYVEIDGRGTGQKGLDMMFSVNNQLGTYEMDDQIGVAKYLTDKFKFIDASRVGIWGWSYGGYATAMTLAKDKEKVFKCGISVAPVTSWRFYDTIYTERYMGINSSQENYKTSDVATDEHVKVLGQHDFFLIHGNADDNVHYQQSMVLARALEKADIMFEQLSYPDEAHSISGTQKHLYHSMDRFWNKCFKQ